MKFPKLKAQLTIKIDSLLKENDYQSIYKLKEEILNELEDLDNYCFNSLVKSSFYLRKYDQVIILYFEFLKNNIETDEILYYTLLAHIALVDIYQALSIINKSSILNDSSILEYLEVDGANYSNLIKTNKLAKEKQLVILITNFIKGIARELANNITIDQEYILLRLFDLINTLYEIGYYDELIQELLDVLKIIFELDI